MKAPVMHDDELIPHLFRTEYGRITAVLCRYFGFHGIEYAEDIASETFLQAMETWPYKGIPPQPAAWLHTVARNKAINLIKRQGIFNAIKANMGCGSATYAGIDIELSDEIITDSQLQMMFALCHASISQESQIALALRLLCGFGINEIASAFIVPCETIAKRLVRAKEKLRNGNVPIVMPPAAELPRRMDTVLKMLYLLFSEGYHSDTGDTVLRKELCFEAMRLTLLLVNCPVTTGPPSAALLALMCFQASRFAAREQNPGGFMLYDEQDENLWDKELVARGVYFLRQASVGERATSYHYEANIAWWYTQKADTPGKWSSILQLYDGLLAIAGTPVARLNRLYALWKTRGAAIAAQEARQLAMDDNYYYLALMGELHMALDPALSIHYFSRAVAHAPGQALRQVMMEKIERLNK